MAQVVRGVVLVCCLVVGGSAGAQAQETQPLVALANAWSGGRTNPVCQKRGPHGEYLDPRLGMEYCQWPTLSSGDNWGVVGGHNSSRLGFADILWERRVRSVGVVNYVLDSLSKALTAKGLTEWRCGNEGRRWENETLGVMFLRGEPLPGGAFKISVMATTIPAVLDGPLCPANPKRPARAKQQSAPLVRKPV